MGLLLVMGTFSSPLLAGQPSFSEAQAEVSRDEGVPPHRIIVTAVMLVKTEVVGNMIIEHYRYEYQILPEEEAMPYEPTSMDEAQAYLDQRQHAVNLRNYFSSYGQLPAGAQGLAEINQSQVNLMDPWFQPYEYQKTSEYEAVISSPGADRIMGTQDDLIMPVSIDPIVDAPLTDAEFAAGLLLLFVFFGALGLFFLGLIVCVVLVVLYSRKRTAPESLYPVIDQH